MNRQEMMQHFDDPPTRPQRQKARVTFGKSEPWHAGWRGWSDVVDVFFDGAKIGELHTSHETNRKRMEYGFRGDIELAKHWPRFDGPVGLKAAKVTFRTLIENSI